MTGAADFEFEALAGARNYRRALADELSPALRGRVIEVGAGIGQMTAELRALPGVEFLQAVEPDPAFCRRFRASLPDCPLIEGTIDDVPAGNWDAIVSSNVLEHIEKDEEELSKYHRLLKERQGALALFVPARPELLAPIDRDFGHFRRYTKPSLVEKLTGTGFRVEKIRYYDLAGYFAWWTLCKMLGLRKFSPTTVSLFDAAVFPLENALERHVLAPPLGKNLLALARAA